MPLFTPIHLFIRKRLTPFLIMLKTNIVEITKGKTGTGLLVENDGYVSPTYGENQKLFEDIRASEAAGSRELPNPFIVSAVFQKYGIENANGRIYPEAVLRREVEKYQQAIKERRAYGECYTPDAECLTEDGWKMITDVTEGDRVMTLNTETNEIEVQEVTGIVAAEWDDNLIRIHGRTIDDIVTPNHGYPLYGRDGNFRRFVTAEEILNSKSEFAHSYIPRLCKLKDMEGGVRLDGKREARGIFLDKRFIRTETVPYRGTVHCIEVPNHTWYVRRNGKAHWTKNCNHPETTAIDLGRIAMNIIELHWEGHTLVGKLEIPIDDGFRKYGIVSTCADMVAQWLISGLRVGVSSRGLGTVRQQMGKLIVDDNYEITCWDFVANPSTPGAWVSMDGEGSLRQFVESGSPEKVGLVERDEQIDERKMRRLDDLFAGFSK